MLDKSVVAMALGSRLVGHVVVATADHVTAGAMDSHHLLGLYPDRMRRRQRFHGTNSRA
jgi:hypothetical protein